MKKSYPLKFEKRINFKNDEKFEKKAHPDQQKGLINLVSNKK
jgi:hypothetical protein